jgi:hypothetical protein
MQEFIHSVNFDPVVWALLGIFAAAGLLALIAPRRFAALTQSSGQWVDTNKILATFDKRFDIDKFILPHARFLGFVVLVGVATLAYVFWNVRLK